MNPKHILAAALLPLALLIAGCGDGEESGSGSADSQETTEAAQEGETTTTAASEEDMPTPMGPPVDLEKSEQYNIAQIASGLSQTQTVTRLAIQAGIVPTLATGGPFTVFAPVNSAFEALPAETVTSIAQDTPQLTTLLQQHVVPGTITSEQLLEMDGESLETAAGTKLLVEVDGEKITVGGAPVAIADITASNGIVHAVEAVIVQPNG